MRIGIFYGSSGGVTQDVATKIKKSLDLDADLIDIADSTKEILNQYDRLILGTSTWGEGDLQDDWEDNLEIIEELDLSGKKVALFGVGDQDGYEDTFVDGMGILYEILKESGATIIGDNWSAEDYDFSESKAFKNNSFVGLVIDEDNQEEKTDLRIDKWVNSIKEDIQ